MHDLRIKRLRSDDGASARVMFAMMADVFEEDCEPLGDHYLKQLLDRESFWAAAAETAAALSAQLADHVPHELRSA